MRQPRRSLPGRLHLSLVVLIVALHAADRGVRVRVLIDDGETVSGDEQITKLEAHPSVEIRIFNPFAYSGHGKLIRGIEYLFNAPRLDYRMAASGAPPLVWLTHEDGKAVEYDVEPARSEWQRLKANVLSLLPADKEL